jgi:hypothetical protein
MQIDWADQRRGPASANKEAVWQVCLGEGASCGVWDGEAKEEQARRPALQQLEDLGTYYVAQGAWQAPCYTGGWAGGEGQCMAGRGSCISATDGRVVWAGGGAAEAGGGAGAGEKAAGLDSACVLERVGKGNDVVERTLGAEVQLFREEDQE